MKRLDVQIPVIRLKKDIQSGTEIVVYIKKVAPPPKIKPQKTWLVEEVAKVRKKEKK